MKRLTASCVVSAGNLLGEGILWCARRQCVYWTDIEAAMLWRHCPSTGVTDTWPMPERLGSFALCEDDNWLLLGLASRLAFLHLPSGKTEPICPVEPGLPTRINDGACDREGRFVFGTKHEPVGGSETQPIGSFYRLDTDLTLHPLPLGNVAIANGIAFSPDGRTMYFCDSPRRVIHRCEYTTSGCARRVTSWIDLRDIPGEPDGAAVDADGGLWAALWGMGRIVRYTPDGREDVTIEIPTRQSTRPALGGPGLSTLYVTSARDGLAIHELSEDRQAGHVFAAPVPFHGLPESRFAGTPPPTPLR
ncbi:MAG: SMP-30/gluconolactonase/LRE family protein [Steroidobacteraceae bacterium]